MGKSFTHQVLDCMIGNNKFLSVDEIKEKTNICSGRTIHGVLKGLRDKGFVIATESVDGYNGNTKRYRIEEDPYGKKFDYTSEEYKTHTSLKTAEKNTVVPNKTVVDRRTWTFTSLNDVPSSVIVDGRKCKISLSFEE